MTDAHKRAGEVALPFDPALTADDAKLVFIGRLSTAWKSRADCPKNLVRARERGTSATLKIDPPWRTGLTGLSEHSHAIVLYWMHQAQRDLIIQSPKHRKAATGTFALRSPVRPNPISLATVQVISVDIATGEVVIDAIDCLDGTPLLDIKPWFPSVDIPPDYA
ncbi:MAG: tRNA (N6-threonylcarbamoyladenosine(37)-N6)-methyltransferase TrmO [Pseudomonadota bacterium]